MANHNGRIFRSRIEQAPNPFERKIHIRGIGMDGRGEVREVSEGCIVSDCESLNDAVSAGTAPWASRCAVVDPGREASLAGSNGLG